MALGGIGVGRGWARMGAGGCGWLVSINSASNVVLDPDCRIASYRVSIGSTGANSREAHDEARAQYEGLCDVSAVHGQHHEGGRRTLRPTGGPALDGATK